MLRAKFGRRLGCHAVVAAVALATFAVNPAIAVNEFFDINGTATGSGVTVSGGSYTFEASTGTGGWNTTSTGLTTATTAWVDGNNFMRFSAGTDAAANSFTVTANTNHTFAGMALQTNGGGTVTIASSGGSVMTLFSNASGQGFFVGGVAAQQLMITAPLAGDATTPLVWQGVLSGTAGSLFLYGNNSGLQGGVQLNSSAGLNFNNANSFGTGTITWGAAASTGTSFTVAAPALGADITISNPMLARNATGTGATTNLTIGNLNGHKVTWSGGLSLVTGVASSVTTNAGVLTEFSGVVTGTDATKAFTKLQTGTLILSNAANSYAGQTTIANGILSVPGVGNSGSNSPLGKNGTINLGATTTAGTLLYTGTGETSDKVLNLAGTTGGGTIDQSGSNNLKFTSNLTAGGVGAKTLTLQGSSAGTGEIAGVIVDNGGANTTALTKTGTGTWTLSGNSANTYTGLTTVSGGELDLNKTGGGAIQNGGLTITGTGSIAKLLQSSQIGDTSAVTVTTNGVLNMNGNSDTVGSLAGAATTGNVTLTGNLTVGGDNTSTSFAGTITGSGGNLTKNGAGTFSLPNAGSNYTGNTTINAGAISVDGDGSIGTGTLNLSGGKFVTSANRTVATPNPINLTASSSITTSSAATTVNFEFSSNSIGGSGGTLTLKNEGADGAGDLLDVRMSGTGFNFARPIVIDNGGTGKTRLSAFNTSGQQEFSGVISGDGSFNRSSSSGGGATTVLSGNNTYTGGTTVNDGTLQANNTPTAGTSGTGNGPVTVNSGGTLGGSGSVNGLVTVNSGGTLSPGASVESLNLGTGTLTFNASATVASHLKFEIGPAGTADLVNAALGDLNIADSTAAGSAAGTTLDLSSAGYVPTGNKYTVVVYDGNWNLKKFKNDINGYVYMGGTNPRQFLIKYDDQNFGGNFSNESQAAKDASAATRFVTLVAVPELGSFLTMGLVGLCAWGAARFGKRFGFTVMRV